MLTKFLSYGSAEALGRGLNWGVLTVLAVLLPPSEYGTVGLLVAVEVVLTNALLLGQDRAVLRFYRPRESGNSVVGSSLAIWLSLAVPLLLGCSLLAYRWQGTIFGVPLWPHLALICFAVVPMQLEALHLAALRMEGEAARYLWWRVGAQTLKVVCVLTAVVGLRNSVGYPIGLLVAAALAGLARLPTLWSRVRGRFSWENGARLLMFGWPFVFHSLNGMLLMFADRFMLEHYLGRASVGVYTFAYMLGSSVVFLYGVTGLLFEPLLYGGATDVATTERRLGIYVVAMIAASASVGMIILLFLPIAAARATHSMYADVLTVTPIVLAAHVLHPLYLQGNLRLMLARRSRVIMYGSAAAALVNVAGNMVLIPRAGVVGAAYATFISIVLLAALVLGSSLLTARVSIRQMVGTPVLLVALVSAVVTALFAGRPASYLALGVLSVVTWGYLFRCHPSTLRKVLSFS